eukprot:3734228-Pyramimonas_sp.AAC.1
MSDPPRLPWRWRGADCTMRGMEQGTAMDCTVPGYVGFNPGSFASAQQEGGVGDDRVFAARPPPHPGIHCAHQPSHRSRGHVLRGLAGS